MKRLLSIIGAISLLGTSTTILVACKNNFKNENNDYNKYRPTPIITKPPENSNWLLVNKNEYKNEFNKKINKWYIIIYYSKYMDENIFVIEKQKISIAGVTSDSCVSFGGGLYVNPLIYRWNAKNEPQIPTINKNNGEINDWK